MASSWTNVGQALVRHSSTHRRSSSASTANVSTTKTTKQVPEMKDGVDGWTVNGTTGATSCPETEARQGRQIPSSLTILMTTAAQDSNTQCPSTPASNPPAASSQACSLAHSHRLVTCHCPSALPRTQNPLLCEGSSFPHKAPVQRPQGETHISLRYR